MISACSKFRWKIFNGFRVNADERGRTGTNGDGKPHKIKMSPSHTGGGDIIRKTKTTACKDVKQKEIIHKKSRSRLFFWFFSLSSHLKSLFCPWPEIYYHTSFLVKTFLVFDFLEEIKSRLMEEWVDVIKRQCAGGEATDGKQVREWTKMQREGEEEGKHNNLQIGWLGEV